MAQPDRFPGCLLGGAVGDALGAPLEFLKLDEIRQTYGPAGIASYVEFDDGIGSFTDDTQMTLFSAEGLLRSHNRAMQKGIGGALTEITYRSYLRWLHTQDLRPYHEPRGGFVTEAGNGWLILEKKLYARRWPGRTCLQALQSGRYGTMDTAINDSKGCGGIMRAAPFGLFYTDDPEEAFRTACDAAAITHGHPSGYLSAGYLAGLLAFLLEGDALMVALQKTSSILKSRPKHEECLSAVEQAVEMSQTQESTPENVEHLGGGWTGETALAIALFCALKFPEDFRGGVLASIHHSGDSDSTGAITGNILGFMVGKQGIPAEWIEKLELAGLVEQVALDLATRVKGDMEQPDPEWEEKYPPG